MRCFFFLVLSIFLLSLVACDTAVGRAVGGDDDGGPIDIPSPPDLGILYKVSGELSTPAPDVDVWTFNGEKDYTAEIHLRTAPGSITTIDTFLVLEGPDGKEIARNDDYDGVHSGMVIPLPESGEYTVVVRGYGMAFGPYDLTFVFQGDFLDDDGGRISEAGASGLSVSYGEIQFGLDEDVWEIPALKGDTIFISLDGITSLDPILTLIDPGGMEVAHSDDYIGQDSQVTYVAKKDGVYLAVAKGYGGKSTGDYIITVSGNPSRSVLNEITETLERAEAELEAVGMLAAAASAAELADRAALASANAKTQSDEVGIATVTAEKAARESALAKLVLEKAETTENKAKSMLETLSAEKNRLDKIVIEDLESLQKIASDSQKADKALALAEARVAELEKQLEGLEAKNVEAYRLLEVAEKRLNAVATAQQADSEARGLAVAQSQSIAVLARNAEKAAKAEAKAQASRANLAELKIVKNKAEFESLSAKIKEAAAAKELEKKSEEAAKAKVVAEKAAALAKKSASKSPLTTVIDGKYVSVSKPNHGTATIVEGQIYYTHDGSSHAVDVFTANVQGEGKKLLDVKMWVTLTYLRPNNAPVMVDDAVSVSVGKSVTIPLTANDIDKDKDKLTITHLNGSAFKPGQGINHANFTLRLCDAKICEPEAIGVVFSSKHGDVFKGKESFTYTVSDGNGLTGIGKLVVSVDPVLPESQKLDVMATKTGTLDVTGLNSESLVSAVTQGEDGKVEVVDNGDDTYKIIYSHTGKNTVSKDQFTYTVTDQHEAQSTVKVQVNVGVLVNRGPTAIDINMTVKEGESTIVFLNGPESPYKALDFDPDGHDITVVIAGSLAHPAKHGEVLRKYDWYNKLSIKSDWEHLGYFHNGGENLKDSFEYCLYDKPDPLELKSSCGFAYVTVIPVNDAPSIGDIEISVKSADSITFDLSSNSSDPEGNELIASVDSKDEGWLTAKYGTLVRQEGNLFKYSHDGTDAPTDSFSYMVADGKGGKSSATVNVKVMTLTLADVGKVKFDPVPPPEAIKVEWDPEIGVRIASNKSFPLVDGLKALKLFECTDPSCDDATNKNVSGKVVEFGEGATQFLSFVPDKPLYGATTYKVAIDDGGIINASDGSVNLSKLIGRTDWAFTTAEMTRFTLPISLKYNDTNCEGTQKEFERLGKYQRASTPVYSERAGPNMCQTLDDINKFVYGWEFKQLNNYLNRASKGKFVVSPLRDKEGRVVRSILLDRGKNYHEGQCFRNFEYKAVPGLDTCVGMYPISTSINEQIASRFDFLRYRNITDKNGEPQLLAPYKPSREVVLGYDGPPHRNVTLIYNWGTSEKATLGAASLPKGGTDTEFRVSHDELYRTWVHELGHAYFGLPDLYWRGDPGPNHQGKLDIMAGNDANYNPMSAWSLVRSEFAEPLAVVTDSQIVSLVSSDEKPSLECGAADNPCTMYSNNADQQHIIKIPAIIERDTRQVKGHYLIEYLDSGEYNSQIALDPDTLNFPDNQARFPGGIVIWKIDETDQKAATSLCPETGIEICTGMAYLIKNTSDTDLPEFYPSVPTIEGGGSGNSTTTSSFHLFPWWYSDQLPFGDDYKIDLEAMPTSIELPVLEIPPISEQIDYGGGKKVATVTLSFDDFVNNLKTGIETSHKEKEQSFFKEYELTDPSIKYTVTVSKLSEPVDMTYKDHVRPGQVKFAKGAMWDEISVYGYQRLGVPVIKQISPASGSPETKVVINSSIPGTARLTGDCSGDEIEVSEGENLISLGKLSEGIYSNCTVIVKNKTDRESWPLKLTEFTVTIED